MCKLVGTVVQSLRDGVIREWIYPTGTPYREWTYPTNDREGWNKAILECLADVLPKHRFTTEVLDGDVTQLVQVGSDHTLVERCVAEIEQNLQRMGVTPAAVLTVSHADVSQAESDHFEPRPMLCFPAGNDAPPSRVFVAGGCATGNAGLHFCAADVPVVDVGTADAVTKAVLAEATSRFAPFKFYAEHVVPVHDDSVRASLLPRTTFYAVATDEVYERLAWGIWKETMRPNPLFGPLSSEHRRRGRPIRFHAPRVGHRHGLADAQEPRLVLRGNLYSNANAIASETGVRGNALHYANAIFLH